MSNPKVIDVCIYIEPQFLDTIKTETSEFADSGIYNEQPGDLPRPGLQGYKDMLQDAFDEENWERKGAEESEEGDRAREAARGRGPVRLRAVRRGQLGHHRDGGADVAAG